jgi:hypothetical protein
MMDAKIELQKLKEEGKTIAKMVEDEKASLMWKHVLVSSKLKLKKSLDDLSYHLVLDDLSVCLS